MTSTENAPTPTNDQGSFSVLRSTNDHDTPYDSTPPIHCQILMHSQVTSSPSVVRNPSPPPIDDLSRADMVGDEMYSKSWFCQVLLKLIQVKNFSPTFSSFPSFFSVCRTRSITR